MIEKSVEQFLKTYARSKGAWAFKILCIGFVGFPDRMIVGPGARVAFAECKRPKGGRRSAAQVKWIEFFQGLGFVAEFVTNTDEARRLVDRMTG